MSDLATRKSIPQWLKWVFIIIAIYLAVSGVLWIRAQRSAPAQLPDSSMSQQNPDRCSLRSL